VTSDNDAAAASWFFLVDIVFSSQSDLTGGTPKCFGVFILSDAADEYYRIGRENVLL
jgi:hypothetical protein